LIFDLRVFEVNAGGDYSSSRLDKWQGNAKIAVRYGRGETRRQGDKETRRQGDKETRRQGDKETRRQGSFVICHFPFVIANDLWRETLPMINGK
jgi:hypothetical protein